jgi:hypothetical protein
MFAAAGIFRLYSYLLFVQDKTIASKQNSESRTTCLASSFLSKGYLHAILHHAATRISSRLVQRTSDNFFMFGTTS